ncbi:cohesin domain-containing protein [Diplocloster agilis]|uniref:cohesin domain-containing protein n=1 Tax=Diplocloster agilis TaxID=2850323 RepID=UPI000821D958|nr:cohesin domain-containing protein [Suonthocola fibrivorans]MCU6736131.1 cohesin domain-containing protein [Suonthocola fibrivorans]SCJ86720.1 Cadherin-like beta sandwich domain [uncultured Clostridium sp.]
MKKLYQVLAVAMVCCLVIPWFPSRVLAASGNLQVSGGSCNVGQTVSVSVKANAADGDIAAMDVTLSYDASLLEYQSSSVNASGGSGSVHLVAQNSAPGQTSLGATVTFKAIAPGNASVNVSNYKVANFNEEVLDIGQPGGASVSVTSPGGGDNGGGGGGNGGGDNGGGDGGGSEKKSANNQLTSLKISPGTLSPSFTGSRTKYTATVPKGTKTVAVSANPMEKEAEVVSIDGTELSNGKTTIKIIVRAPNGNEATYSIAVTEEAKSQETPTPTPTPDEEQPKEDDTLEAAVGSEIRLVSEKFTDEEIPQGFEPYTSSYKQKEIKSAKMTNSDMELLYLVDENKENGRFYIYNPQSETFSNFIQIPIGLSPEEGGFLIPIPAPDPSQVPQGYEQIQVELDGIAVEGYQVSQTEVPQEGAKDAEPAPTDQSDANADGDGSGNSDDGGGDAAADGILNRLTAMFGPMTVYATEAQDSGNPEDGEGSEEPENPEDGAVPASDSASSYQLIYAMDNNGLEDWYSFDPVQQTFQKYVPAAVADTGSNDDTAAELAALQKQMGINKDEADAKLAARFKIICALIVLAVLLLFVVINLILKVNRMKRGDDWEDDDDFDDKDYDEMEPDDDNWLEQLPMSERIMKKTQEGLRDNRTPKLVKPDIRELTPPSYEDTESEPSQDTSGAERTKERRTSQTSEASHPTRVSRSASKPAKKEPVVLDDEAQIMDAVEKLMNESKDDLDDLDIDLDVLDLDDDDF